ncbi:hypothetical protein PHLCEN_2v3071, partial [Hermanssonia centrifuga]
ASLGPPNFQKGKESKNEKEVLRCSTDRHIWVNIQCCNPRSSSSNFTGIAV